jgi:hypothetical protein
VNTDSFNDLKRKLRVKEIENHQNQNPNELKKNEIIIDRKIGGLIN